MEDKKARDKKRIKKLLMIIAGLILLIILSSIYSCACKKDINADLKISGNQVNASDPKLTKTEDNQFFELVGFGQLPIDSKNPNINLINPSDNSVYLSFDVIYNDKTLYQTGLIEPGMMEQYDIYSLFDAGTQTIIYKINVYDLVDKKPLWSGIEQQQELLISK